MSDTQQTGDWQLEGKTPARDLFNAALVPDRVLIDYGIPVLFTAKGSGDLPFLVFHVEEILAPTYRSRHIAAPATPGIISGLETGARSIRDALTASWMWVVDTDESGNVVAASQVDENDLPVDALPDAMTMLSPALQPAITLRYSGDQLAEDAIPASVIQIAGESLQAALRVLVDYLSGTQGSRGRRTKNLTALYNLSAQRVAMSSFEIAFRRPDTAPTETQPPLEFSDTRVPEPLIDLREIEKRMWQMLRDGLNWTAPASALSVSPIEPSESQLATLRALEKLAPKSSVIGELHVSGQMVARPATGEGYLLNRETSLHIRAEKIRLEEALQSTEETEVHKGLIRYVDPDLWTLMLRSEDDLLVDPPEGTIFYLTNQQDFDLAMDLNAKTQHVAIVAKRQISPGKTASEWEVTQISLLTELQSSG